jgi:hypothetical protein
MSEGSGSRLLALIDGVALPEEEGKALWREFSAHMDEHRGDMAGFAKKKGWVSVSPEHRGGKAVLLVQTTAAPPEARPAKKGPANAEARPAKKGPANAEARPAKKGPANAEARPAKKGPANAEARPAKKGPPQRRKPAKPTQAKRRG